MSRSLIRFVLYDRREDKTAEEERSARCVWGEEKECGAESGTLTPAALEEWMLEHVKETRHTRFRVSVASYVVWEPREEVPAPTPVLPELEPAKVERVKA
jgi:hypothetical protein